MKRRDMILTGLAATGLGGWYLARQSAAPTFAESLLVSAANAQETASEAPVDTAPVTEMVLGDENAPVTMVEYASFTCPHCADFHNIAFKQLKKDFIDTGKVRFIYREAYFDRFGLWASLIARCGGQEKYFGIINLIYASQSEWTRAGEPVAILEELRKIGRLAGLDNDKMEACLQDKQQIEKLITWYQGNIERDKVKGTPSFIVNGEMIRNLPYSEMKAVLDEAVKG